MELPSFDVLWQTSAKLVEFETILEKIDLNNQHVQNPPQSSNTYRGSLFGAKFESEDQEYYEPFRYCCEDAFYTQPEYEAHVETHIQCNFDGCYFVSHQKLLRLHQELHHGVGTETVLYRESSDQRVIDWRSTRKRNYPTIEKVSMRAELLSQQTPRYQVLKTQEFCLANQKNQAVFTTQCLDRNSGDAILIGEDTSFTATSPSAKKPVSLELSIRSTLTIGPVSDVNTKFRLVAAEYDTDKDTSSDESVAPRTTPSLKDAMEKCEDVTDKVSRCHGRRTRGGRRQARKLGNQSKSSSTSNSGNTFVDPDSYCRNPFVSHPIVQIQTKRSTFSGNPDRIHCRPTLLHMLLAEDIRAERNRLMQCVRYVIQNKFFLNEPQESTENQTTRS